MNVWVYFSSQLIPKFVLIPKDKLNKSTRICLIYFSRTQFNDNMKFLWRNLNINDLMLINLHISLITKRFFPSFDRHSDKTVTLSELLLDINNFSNKIVDVIRKSHEFSFKIVQVITIFVWIPIIFLWISAYDVRALPADTWWRHDLPPSSGWVHLPIFYTPCLGL